MTMYAAYGENLNPEVMLLRAPHSPLLGTGWLSGWRLTFCGGNETTGALPTVVESRTVEDALFVAVYDITPRDEHLLDQWESGLHKLRVRVEMLEGQQTAWLYFREEYEGGLPAPSTVAMLAEAAEAAGAPTDYVSELLNRPCAS